MLTPVAKAFSTDIGIEVASLGVQVHGGMGFIEETGAAQHYRDARIAAIYEGTNGIQAIDLVTRKVPLEGGQTVAAYIDELRATVVGRDGEQCAGLRARLRRVLAKRSIRSNARPNGCWRRSRHRTRWPARHLICACSAMPPAAACWPNRRLAALRDSGDGAGRTALARFFAENVAVQAIGPRAQRHRRRAEHYQR